MEYSKLWSRSEFSPQPSVCWFRWEVKLEISPDASCRYVYANWYSCGEFPHLSVQLKHCEVIDTMRGLQDRTEDMITLSVLPSCCGCATGRT